MDEYKSLAYQRLTFSKDPRRVDDGIVEFMQTLCELEQEMLKLERQASKQELDITGMKATREISKLESKHSDFLSELDGALEAVTRNRLSKIQRYPEEEYSERTRESISEFRDDFLDMINRLEEISDRTGRRIDAKRNSANTRLIFSISCIAATISFFALLSQIIRLLLS